MLVVLSDKGWGEKGEGIEIKSTQEKKGFQTPVQKKETPTL